MTHRALTRRALSLAVLGAAFAMAAGVAAGITALSDEFDSSASLGAWTAMDGDLQGGTSPTHAVEGGELTITPGRSWWVDGVRAFYLHKEVRGDFKVTARIKATGTQSPLPTANWSLSGLLVRRATDNAANENWVAFRSGLVGGRSVLERKTTRASHSDLVLDPIQRGWIELRIARVGPRFVLLRRLPGRSWKLHWSYSRADLPARLQVGVDAFSGYDDTRADLVSHVDFVRFAPTGVPPKLKRRFLAGRVGLQTLVPYLSR